MFILVIFYYIGSTLMFTGEHGRFDTMVACEQALAEDKIGNTNADLFCLTEQQLLQWWLDESQARPRRHNP